MQKIITEQHHFIKTHHCVERERERERVNWEVMVVRSMNSSMRMTVWLKLGHREGYKSYI